MPKVSVVMSLYNGKKYLMEAINSILNQTFRDFEFIIIDDGSDESVHNMLSTLADERIKLITNEKNIGLTASLNKGLFKASGEFIARQDADDMSEPSRFYEQVSYLDKHPEIGVVGTSTTIINENGEKVDYWDAVQNPMGLLKTGNRLTHGSVMLRRTVMDDIGKYDYHFKYAQDYEYWLRVSKKHQIRNIPVRLYQSRFHNRMLSTTKIKEQAQYVICAQRMHKTGEEFSYELDMTKPEKIRYHTMLAYSYIQADKMSEAVQEFKEIFKLNPFNSMNLIRIISYLFRGRDGIIKIQNNYRKLRCAFY
ncbi:MAG: glycosyltransferase [Candidatus Ratteibacteria bacterium]|nr:glycosyltransferase [Candidatus Ratteibacteria bacterium]